MARPSRELLPEPTPALDAARRLLSTIADSRAALLEVAAEHLEPMRARRLARSAERFEARTPVLIEILRREQARRATIVPVAAPPSMPVEPASAPPRRGSPWVPTELTAPRREATRAELPPPPASDVVTPAKRPELQSGAPAGPHAVASEPPVVRAALALRLLEEGLPRGPMLAMLGLSEEEFTSLLAPARMLDNLADAAGDDVGQQRAPAPVLAEPVPPAAPAAPPPAVNSPPEPVAPPVRLGRAAPAGPTVVEAPETPPTPPVDLAAWGLDAVAIAPPARDAEARPAKRAAEPADVPEVRFPTLDTPIALHASRRGAIVAQVRWDDLPTPRAPEAPATPVVVEVASEAPRRAPGFSPELRLPELAPSVLSREVSEIRLAGVDEVPIAAAARDPLHLEEDWFDDGHTQPAIPTLPAPTVDHAARAAAAHAAAKAGRFDDATAIWNELLTARPEEGEALLARGRCLVELGDFVGAAADFERAEALFPGRPEPVLALADLAFTRKDWRTAVTRYDAVLKTQPSHALSLCRRGLAHLHLRGWRAALADLEAAQATDPSLPQVDAYVRMARKGLEGRG